VVMRQLSEMARRRPVESAPPPAFNGAPVPHRWRLYADMATLFLQDPTLKPKSIPCRLIMTAKG